MTELKCKNCGAPLRQDGRCEYCGSVFVLEAFERAAYREKEAFECLPSACCFDISFFPFVSVSSLPHR